MRAPKALASVSTRLSAAKRQKEVAPVSRTFWSLGLNRDLTVYKLLTQARRNGAAHWVNVDAENRCQTQPNPEPFYIPYANPIHIGALS
jgi:hypothetical protein